MKNLTPIEKLDIALSELKKNGYKMNANTMAEAFRNNRNTDIEIGDAERILLKLENDGYVTAFEIMPGNTWYQISFDGYVFEEEGGYKAMILRNQNESELIQHEKDLLTADRKHNLAVAKNMEANASRLNSLTFWLAVGSGILAAIELIKFVV